MYFVGTIRCCTRVPHTCCYSSHTRVCTRVPLRVYTLHIPGYPGTTSSCLAHARVCTPEGTPRVYIPRTLPNARLKQSFHFLTWWYVCATRVQLVVRPTSKKGSFRRRVATTINTTAIYTCPVESQYCYFL